MNVSIVDEKPVDEELAGLPDIYLTSNAEQSSCLDYNDDSIHEVDSNSLNYSKYNCSKSNTLNEPQEVDTTIKTEDSKSMTNLSSLKIEISRLSNSLETSDEKYFDLKHFCNSKKKILHSNQQVISSKNTDLAVVPRNSPCLTSKHQQEGSSIGSQSENTDSASTVLDTSINIKNLSKECRQSVQNNLLCMHKPNFIVGGAISSPRSSKHNSITSFGFTDSKTYNRSQEDSLTSAISIDSTQHPESSECITPLSVISISSFASSKKLEWDSGADLGYAGKGNDNCSEIQNNPLSTLERIAIGNYASILQNDSEDAKSMPLKNSKSSLLKTKDTEHMHGKKNSYGSLTSLRIKDKRSVNKNFHSRSDKYKSYSYSTSSEENEQFFGNRKMRKHSTSNACQLNIKNGECFNKNFYKLARCKASKSTDDFHRVTSTNWNNLRTSSKVSAETLGESIGTGTTLVASVHSLPSTFESSKNSSLRNSDSSVHIEDNDENPCAISLKNSRKNEVKDIVKETPADGIDVLKLSMVKLKESLSSKEVNENIESLDIALLALAKKMKKYLKKILLYSSNSTKKYYKKLNAYIDFIALPSKNEDEKELKKSVADILMTMFGVIEEESSKASSSISSESSAAHDDISLELKETSKRQSVPANEKEELDQMLPCLPYRPSSVCKTYFIVAEEKKDSQLMGGDISKLEEPCTSNSVIPTMQESATNKNSDKMNCENEEDCSSIGNSSRTGIYQDKRGKFHIAHQPHDFIDDHQSESTSDNENYKQPDDTESMRGRDEQLRDVPVAWSSTGSESAYETIRERRSIGEALASSFEFYSTSPRNARVVGYVSSPENELKKSIEIDENHLIESPSMLIPSVSPSLNSVNSAESSVKEFFSTDAASPSASGSHSKVTRIRRNRKPTRNRLESVGTSSATTSLTPEKRQKYFQKIHKYINILERLEKTLVPLTDIEKNAEATSGSCLLTSSDFSRNEKGSSSSLSFPITSSGIASPRKTSTLKSETARLRQKLKKPQVLPRSGSSGSSSMLDTDGRKGSSGVTSKELWNVDRKIEDMSETSSGTKERQDHSETSSNGAPVAFLLSQTPRADFLETQDIQKHLKINSSQNRNFVNSKIAKQTEIATQTGRSLIASPVLCNVEVQTNLFPFSTKEVRIGHEVDKREDFATRAGALHGNGKMNEPNNGCNLKAVGNLNITNTEGSSGVDIKGNLSDTSGSSLNHQVMINKSNKNINSSATINFSELYKTAPPTTDKVSISSVNTTENTARYLDKMNLLPTRRIDSFTAVPLVRTCVEDKPKQIKKSSSGSVQRNSVLQFKGPKRSSVRPTSTEKLNSTVDSIDRISKENSFTVSKSTITLQEALALAKPGYIKKADKRRMKICHRQAIRLEVQERNREMMSRLPVNLKVPKILNKFLVDPGMSPVFDYKTIREQNKKVYEHLPEAQKPKILKKKGNIYQTNRLLASYYSKKLKENALSGMVSHAHRNILSES